MVQEIDLDLNKIGRPPHDFTGIVYAYIGSKLYFKGWVKSGNYHRDDGPAVEYSNGDRTWFQNGSVHREDGPAITRSNAEVYWFLNGSESSFEKVFEKASLEQKEKMIWEMDLWI